MSGYDQAQQQTQQRPANEQEERQPRDFGPNSDLPHYDPAASFYGVPGGGDSYLSDPDADTTFGTDVSSPVGQGSTTFDTNTALSTVTDITGGGGFVLMPDGNGGWGFGLSNGVVSNSTTVNESENGTTVNNTTEVDTGLVTTQHSLTVGNTIVNDRMTGSDSSLAFDMTRITGADEVDVVGAQDRLSLKNGFTTTDELPISIGHSEEISTGHDTYAFGTAGSENSDEARNDRLSENLAEVDGVTDITMDTLANMEVGDGFAFVDDLTQQERNSVTGRRKLGPLSGSLTVGFGSGDKESQQTMVALTDEDTVTISLMQADGDINSSEFGLGIGFKGVNIGASVGSSTEQLGYTQVDFDIDVSTPEGQKQFEQFTQTGLLPGADQVDDQNDEHAESRARYAELAAEMEGLDPDSEAYHEAQLEIFDVAGELNNEFMELENFRETHDQAGDEVDYTRHRAGMNETTTTSASLWAAQASSISRVDREWDQYDLEDGNFDYEAGFFTDTRWTEGGAMVVASPNSAPDLALGSSSRADFGAFEGLYERGLLPEGALTPEMEQAIFEDGLDDFKDGGVQITTALTERQMDLLAQEGGDFEGILAGDGIRHDIWEAGRHSEGERILGEVMETIADNDASRHSEEDLDAFLQEYGINDGEGFDATKFREEMASVTPEQFAEMDPLTREMFVNTRAVDLAVNDRNPWEMISVVQQVQDPEERAHLTRELFENIENIGMTYDEFSESYEFNSFGWSDASNTGTLLLMEHMSTVASGVSDPVAEDLMGAVRIDMVDKRAADWADERIVSQLNEGKTQDEVLDSLIEDHIDWSVDKENWDQLSDNFQATAIAGGPEMVTALIERMGPERLESMLASTAAEDPARLAIWHDVLAGTEYADQIPS